MHRFLRLCSNESPLLFPENKERLFPHQTDKQKEIVSCHRFWHDLRLTGYLGIAGTIAIAYLGFFTPRGRAGLDVYTVSGAVALDVFSKAPYGEIAWVGFALRFDQPSPQVFSARSFLDSTMNCDIIEKDSPRTPFSRPLSPRLREDNGSREKI